MLRSLLVANFQAPTSFRLASQYALFLTFGSPLLGVWDVLWEPDFTPEILELGVASREIPVIRKKASGLLPAISSSSEGVIPRLAAISAAFVLASAPNALTSAASATATLAAALCACSRLIIKLLTSSADCG